MSPCQPGRSVPASQWRHCLRDNDVEVLAQYVRGWNCASTQQKLVPSHSMPLHRPTHIVVEHLLTFALSFIHNKRQLQSCQQSRNQNIAIFIQLRNITQHKSACHARLPLTHLHVMCYVHWTVRLVTPINYSRNANVLSAGDDNETTWASVDKHQTAGTHKCVNLGLSVFCWWCKHWHIIQGWTRGGSM